MELKKREEIKESMKWDLTTIFKTDDDFNAAFEEAQNLIKAFPAHKETMLNSAKDLYKTLTDYFGILEKEYKLYEYANLNNDSDLANSDFASLKGKVDKLSTEFSEATVFIDNQILSLPKEKFNEYLVETSDDYNLNDFKIYLTEVYRYKDHILPEEQEKVIAAFSEAFDTPENVFTVLSDADLKLGTIKDENGKDVELTSSNYAIYIRSANREVRKAAFEQSYKIIGSFKNTFAALYAGDVKTSIANAKLRHYDSALQASLFADSVTPEIYKSIIDNISGHLDVLFKYYNLKKEILGLKDMHMYDIYLPMLNESSSKKYTFEEAKNEVLNAVSIFGENYVNILKNGYDSRWVDVYPNKGKKSGAYSAGSAGTNPFILLNFIGTRDSVSTLAHESGHSMHSYFSRSSNPSWDAYYRIFVAEVPSTVNELVLDYYQLEHSTDDKEKLCIINEMLELYKATVYRQIMFAEFEMITKYAAEKGQTLTADYLCDEYYKMNQKYFGDTVTLDKQIAYEWMKVPHFYYNFYVYKYAIGLTAASHIVSGIRSGKKDALDNYLKFLKLGGTKSPIEELKVAGVDLTDPKVYDDAIGMFDDLIEQFKALYKKVYNK